MKEAFPRQWRSQHYHPGLLIPARTFNLQWWVRQAGSQQVPLNLLGKSTQKGKQPCKCLTIFSAWELVDPTDQLGKRNYSDFIVDWDCLQQSTRNSTFSLSVAGALKQKTKQLTIK